MAVLLFQALANLTEANSELGMSPRVAFIRAFTQVMASSHDDLVLLSK